MLNNFYKCIIKKKSTLCFNLPKGVSLVLEPFWRIGISWCDAACWIAGGPWSWRGGVQQRSSARGVLADFPGLGIDVPTIGGLVWNITLKQPYPLEMIYIPNGWLGDVINITGHQSQARNFRQEKMGLNMITTNSCSPHWAEKSHMKMWGSFVILICGGMYLDRIYNPALRE